MQHATQGGDPRRTRIAFLFSGQGSQYFQMGEALYAEHPTFRRWMQRLDAQVLDLTGHSVVHALYASGRGKADTFDHTLLTHPAIFVTEYALAQALIEAGLEPDVVVGASLGMFAAAALSGCMDVEEALTAVIRHAQAMENACEPGTMIAVLAAPRMFETSGLESFCELAAINFHSHFVISVPAAEAARAESILQRENLTFQRLPVAFAFHSRWIDPAEHAFKAYAATLQMKPAQIPLACCARSQLLLALPGDHLWTITREPIRFQRTLHFLERDGPYRYIDAGPSGTLATFTRYALPSESKSRAFPVLTPFGRDIECFNAAVAAT
jgi:acyl transferase domain-containing protein